MNELKRSLDYLKEEVQRLEQKEKKEARNRNNHNAEKGNIVISLKRGYNEHRRLTYSYLKTTQGDRELKL